jgi:hypothetical protein
MSSSSDKPPEYYDDNRTVGERTGQQRGGIGRVRTDGGNAGKNQRWNGNDRSAAGDRIH